jgi:GWxTD domain-containing protein
LRRLFPLLLLASVLLSAEPGWLDKVAPVMSAAEKKAYLGLNQEERQEFEEKFWANKSISAEEYFRRVQYIDATFGSGKAGSGANTDQGAVYLSLGPPTKITQLPSSRIFVPLEIWYYDVVPGLLNTELRLIFYRKNSIGFPKLYSPTLNTIRALLLPEAATVEAFGPNDSLTESDIRQVLNVPPAEDEVISAAVNVATGIKYSGNDEILGRITSPREMLGKPPETQVTSRLITAHTKLDVWETTSEYGGSQIDLRLEATAGRDLDLEVLAGAVPVYHNRVRLDFSEARPIVYTHRLDLLPGSYRLLFTVDDKPAPYALEVKDGSMIGKIFRADLSDATGRRQTPFEFEGRQIDLNPNGRFAVVWFPQPETVTWRIRKGLETVWRSVTTSSRLATVELPTVALAPGTYTIEAATATDSRTSDLVIGRDAPMPAEATLVSYNANLAPAVRLAFIGHQWLLRGKLDEARRNLNASLEKGATDDAQVELGRVDALAGNLDAARGRARGVLNRNPNSFEALSVLAYVEAQLQDYRVAAELYHRALAIQDSPELRAALAEITRRESGK